MIIRRLLESMGRQLRGAARARRQTGLSNPTQDYRALERAGRATPADAWRLIFEPNVRRQLEIMGTAAGESDDPGSMAHDHYEDVRSYVARVSELINDTPDRNYHWVEISSNLRRLEQVDPMHMRSIADRMLPSDWDAYKGAYIRIRRIAAEMLARIDAHWLEKGSKSSSRATGPLQQEIHEFISEVERTGLSKVLRSADPQLASAVRDYLGRGSISRRELVMLLPGNILELFLRAERASTMLDRVKVWRDITAVTKLVSKYIATSRPDFAPPSVIKYREALLAVTRHVTYGR